MGLIRFILACGVVLGHTSTIEGYTPLGGALAVQCFYIISGYYMAMILTNKYVGRGARYLFYSNRAAKIYPVYWLNLAILVALNLVVLNLGYPGTFDFYLKYQSPSFGALVYLLFANLAIIGLDWTFLFGINKSGNLYFTKNFNATSPNVYNYALNSIAWTVGVELLFYVFAPWLNKQKWTILLGILLFSLLLRVMAAIAWLDLPPWNYMFFPTQIMFFLAGMLSYKFFYGAKKIKVSPMVSRILFGVLLVIVLFYYQFFPESYLKNGVLFLAVTVITPFAFDLSKKNSFDRFLGNISYPIYISQELIIHITSIKRFPRILDQGLTTIILDVIFSILIYKFFFVYIEKWRARRVTKAQNEGMIGMQQTD